MQAELEPADAVKKKIDELKRLVKGNVKSE
jgi:hypothetical protein